MNSTSTTNDLPFSNNGGHSTASAAITTPVTPQGGSIALTGFEGDMEQLMSPSMQHPSSTGSLSMPSTVYAPITPPADPSEPVLALDPVQFKKAVQIFFDLVHPSIPLFDKAKSLDHSWRDALDRGLSQVMAAITLVIIRCGDQPQIETSRNYLEHCLSTSRPFEAELQGDISVETLQRACLLAYYSFHQGPGQHSWMRIGILTRKAYALGLHQLDFAPLTNTVGSVNGSSMGSDDFRRLWWVVYCLDSYSNITAATPFIIESQSIATALTPAVTELQDGQARSSNPVFLATEPADLWETAQAICSQPNLDHYAMHIVLSVLMREAATVFRLEIQRPDRRLQARIAAAKDNFTQVRFAMPGSYLQFARLPLGQEQTPDHMLRLTNIILFHGAQIMLALAAIVDLSRPPDREPWSSAIERCEDIVNAIRHWDADSMTCVDPALCFIIATCMSVMHIYSICDITLTAAQREQLQRHQNILTLFLQRFAIHWYTPGFLLDSFTKFKTLLGPTMSFSDARSAMILYHGQLHQKAAKRLVASVSQEANAQSFQDDASWINNFDMGDMNLYNGFFRLDDLGSF